MTKLTDAEQTRISNAAKLGRIKDSTQTSGERDVQEIHTDAADIRTLDQLLEAAKVNRDEWEVVSFDVNKWGVGMKLEKKDLEFVKGAISGSVKSDGTVILPIFQVKARLRPRQDKHLLKLRDGMIAQIARLVAEPVQALVYDGIAKAKHLLEVDPFDMHFLKYCWAAETVSDYDLNLASKYFKYAIEDLINKARGFGIERVLMVVGNDALHVDGPKNLTAGGTPMDTDTRFAKGFIRAHELHSWAIRRLKQIAPVDILVVAGNHDETAAWHLGHVLATEFKNDPNVSVENGTRPRKYYKYGVNLLGFTHGHEEKETDLPLLMAREVPQLWAQTEHREWHKGHKHKYSETQWKSAESYAGVIVRTLNSLSAHDLWHTKKGYTDRRAMQAFIHNAVTGYVGSFSANVFHDGSIPGGASCEITEQPGQSVGVGN